MAKRRNLVEPGKSERFPEESLYPDFRLYSRQRFDMHFGRDQILGGREDRLTAEFKRKIGAAITSAFLGIGLQYAYNRYTRPDEYEDKEHPPRYDLKVEYALDAVSAAIEGDYHFPKADDPDFGDWLGWLSLTKALSALNGAHTLAHQGQLIESITLTRLSLEKLALIAYACVHPDFQDPFAISPRQCVATATQVLPEIGKFYGVLSKFAHWEPEIHVAFLAARDDGTPGIWISSPSHKAAALLAVAMAHSAALRVFLRQMQRFHPTRPVERTADACVRVREVISQLLERTRGKTSIPNLIAELENTWMMVVE